MITLPTFNLHRTMETLKRKNPEWSEEYLATMEGEYRKFLALCVGHKNMCCPLAVDEVWHTHMLDSVHYFKDCNEYFGQYLHHNPSDGKTPSYEAGQTLERYKKMFGEPNHNIWTDYTCMN